MVINYQSVEITKRKYKSKLIPIFVYRFVFVLFFYQNLKGGVILYNKKSFILIQFIKT